MVKIFLFVIGIIAAFNFGFLFARRFRKQFARFPTKLEALFWQVNDDGYDEDLFKIDYERYSSWVRASIAWLTNPQKVSTVVYHIQTLGIVDARIYGRKLNDYHDGKDWICDSNGVMLRERDMILADLWLLGAYEFIRAVDQRYRKKTGAEFEKVKILIKETKDAFHRVRIPLAKNEIAKGYEGNDDVAAPIGCGENGFGWHVNKDTLILQRDLSDKFLKMIRSVKPGWLLSEAERNEYKYQDEQSKDLSPKDLLQKIPEIIKNV